MTDNPRYVKLAEAVESLREVSFCHNACKCGKTPCDKALVDAYNEALDDVLDVIREAS